MANCKLQVEVVIPILFKVQKFKLNFVIVFLMRFSDFFTDSLSDLVICLKVEAKDSPVELYPNVKSY